MSEDIIESFPDGAVARRGPWKAIFSPELNAESVFDIELPEGTRIRGGVRAIQLTDLATGKSMVLGTVKDSVPGEVIPPNNVVYRSAFDGIEADVLLVWTHNHFSQNVILKERPALPPGLNRETSRLEVVTELVEMPEAEVSFTVIREPGKPELRDDLTFQLGSMAAIQGRAFPISGAKALALTGEHLLNGNGLPVVKQLIRAEDERVFVIESLGWEEIQPMLKDLRSASRADNSTTSGALADGRTWPKPVAALAKREPMLVASAPYQNDGFLVDLDLSGTAVNGYIFLSGVTYYIANSFTIANCASGSADFRAGTVVKYANNAYLRVSSCSINNSTVGQTQPVFTSKDDDLFGETLPNSTHVPTRCAAPAIQVYNAGWSTTLNNARIRHAKTGVEIYAGNAVPHSINNTLFQECDFGIKMTSYPGTASYSNVTYCNVT